MAGRHDRAYGRYHAPGSKGGSQRRKQPALAPAGMGGRKGGASKPDNAPKPQKPKGTPKGHS